MSFMFKPYPYDDPTAINRPALPKDVVASLVVGNEAACNAIVAQIKKYSEKRTVFLALDGHIGAEWQRTMTLLQQSFTAEGIRFTAFDVASLYKTSDELEAMLAENLPNDREIDPVLLFGKIFQGDLENLFDAEKAAEQIDVWKRQGSDEAAEKEVVCVYGCGAACKLAREIFDVVAYFDVAPLQTALRVQAGKVSPLGDAGRRTKQYIFRRLYYVDYEVSMCHRQELIADDGMDFYVDANRQDTLKLMPLTAFKHVLAIQATYPFRCKPVYIEGVWGGYFIQKLRHLPGDMKNCAWVFDLIPNEVSLPIKVGRHTLEVPYSTFFRSQAEAVMGRASVERFGDMFPIRFNYDDTYMGNGNMSIQVHPPRDYAMEHFGEPFQQDESYYVVKTGGSHTYLGLRDDADADEFCRLVKRSEAEHVPFDYEQYVNSFESHEGDQFLLPGGTIHASGKNQVVLEIGSATVGSYTFKLYDYLRLDLDGVPRPIHSKHGEAVLNRATRRSTAAVTHKPAPRLTREGDGWREYVIGEHNRIFFSLRRLEFDRIIQDDTQGKFHVLNLVVGDEVLVYSLENPERFFCQHYCEMVVVPASFGKYGILNLGDSPCKMTKTVLK
jgi:mannose-6-phosphate isomerase class I